MGDRPSRQRRRRHEEAHEPRAQIAINTLRRYTLSLVTALAALGATSHAQVVRQSSWSIQDRHNGLRQELAETVIASADEWLTRRDPDAPIARLDEHVRVTVVDEIDPTTGHVRPRLAQLVLGTIVIDSSFHEFLDPATISSLVRRDHFWRDESVVEFTGSGEPYRLRTPRDLVQQIPESLPQETPRIRVGLDEISARIGDRLRLFEYLGNEMLALPGNSLGRIRTGVMFDRLRMWAELPLPIGTESTPAIPRTLEATFGAGMSFDADLFSAAITWSDAVAGVGSPARDGDTLFVMSRSALFAWTIPLHRVIGDDVLLLRVGGGYQQFIPLLSSGDVRTEGVAIDVPKLLVRAEYSHSIEGETRRSAAAELFGTSALVSYHEQLSRLFGLRIVAAAHGIIGGRPSYLPAYTVLVTPTFSIW